MNTIRKIVTALVLCVSTAAIAGPYCQTDSFDGHTKCATRALAADGYWMVSGLMLRSQILEIQFTHSGTEAANIDGPLRYKVDSAEPQAVELTDAPSRILPGGVVAEIGRYGLSLDQLKEMVSANETVRFRISAGGGYQDITIYADSQTFAELKAFASEVSANYKP